MKSTLRYYTPVALLMAGIVALAAVVTAFTGTVGMPRRTRTVVTTTYPLYVAVRNILGDTDTLTAENLTGSATGCLHDYQLSPANRITLQNASLVLLNGGGAESFLTDTLAALPQLPTVDTAVGIDLLSSCHAHDHPHDHADAPAQDGHTANEHLWVSPTRYAVQITAACEALCALDSRNAAIYRENGRAYREKVLAVGDRLRASAARLKSKNCVIFHDSLAYLADEMGLTVTAALHVGEESGLSASDLAAAQQAVVADENTALLYDSQYIVRYAAIDRLVPSAQVLTVDTAVVGNGHAADWLDAMERTCRLFEQLTEGTA